VDARQLGKWVAIAGIALAALGVCLWGGFLSWFGHLPGDLRIEGERTRVYVPITSMLIVSAGASLALWLLRRLGGG
jgi:hypothetical protein